MAANSELTVHGIGRLLADPEIRYTQNGHTIATLPLMFTHGTGEKARNCRVEATLWDKSAEIVQQYVHVGDSFYIISGHMEEERWTDKETNKPRSKHVIAVDRFRLLDGRQNNQEQDEGASGGTPSDADAPPERQTAPVPAPQEDPPLPNVADPFASSPTGPFSQEAGGSPRGQRGRTPFD